jgi:hypothetical protein
MTKNDLLNTDLHLKSISIVSAMKIGQCNFLKENIDTKGPQRYTQRTNSSFNAIVRIAGYNNVRCEDKYNETDKDNCNPFNKA